MTKTWGPKREYTQNVRTKNAFLPKSYNCEDWTRL